MSAWLDPARELLHRADAEALPRALRAASVNPERVRAQLRAAGRPFVDPEALAQPRSHDVDQTARWVVTQAASRHAWMGGLLGSGGVITLPTEIVGGWVAVLRLAQRLAVVYGLDPRTERGGLAVRRALAVAFSVELPEQGTVGMRVSGLPEWLTRGLPRNADGQLGRAIARQSANLAFRRVLRWIPVAAAGASAYGAHADTQSAGDRMCATLRALADAPRSASVVDAVEL